MIHMVDVYTPGVTAEAAAAICCSAAGSRDGACAETAELPKNRLANRTIGCIPDCGEETSLDSRRVFIMNRANAAAAFLNEIMHADPSQGAYVPGKVWYYIEIRRHLPFAF